MIGHGSSVSGLLSSDFGLGAIILHIGLPISFLLIYYLFSVLLKGYITLQSCLHKSNVVSLDHYLLIINILLSFGWFASLIHYTPAVEVGGRQIFAYHISLVIYFTSKLSVYNQSSLTISTES